MKTVLLGDIAKIGDGLHGTPAYDPNGEIPFINGNNLVDGNITVKKDTKMCDVDTFKKHQKYMSANTILLSINGTIGNLAKYDGRDYVLGKSACYIDIIDPEKVNRDYLYYICKSKAFQEFIKTGATGTTIKNVPLKAIRNYRFELPGLADQKRVVDILGAIDKKIELNRKMSETLEQTGHRLFRHYFFDNPAAAQWSNRKLGEFFPVKTGKKDANFSTPDGEYPFFTCAQTISRAPDFSFDAHALLLAGNGDFNLKLYRGKFEAYQRTYVLIPNSERNLGFLYFLMSTNLDKITGGSRGSVIKFITKGMIEDFSLPLPDDEQLQSMVTTLNQLTQKIEMNTAEIQGLTDLRDSLLPRLISGKLKV